MSRRSFNNAAALITTSRFCDSPMLPACSTTKEAARPCVTAKSFCFGDGTIAAVSAQL